MFRSRLWETFCFPFVGVKEGVMKIRTSLVCLYFVLGLSGGFLMDFVLYYMYRIGIGVPEGALMIGVSFLPWVIKPFVGFWQDRTAKYRDWVVWGVLLVAMSFFALVLAMDRYWLMVLILFLANVGRMVTDVAVDGIAVASYSEEEGPLTRTLMEAFGFLGGMVGFPVMILVLGDSIGLWLSLLACVGMIFVIISLLAISGIPSVVKRVARTLSGREFLSWGWEVRPYLVLGLLSSMTFAVGKVVGVKWLLSLGYGPTIIAVFLIGNFLASALGAFLSKAEREFAGDAVKGLLSATAFLAVAYASLGVGGWFWGKVPFAVFFLIAFSGFADGFFVGAVGILFSEVSKAGDGASPAAKFSILIASTNLSIVIFSVAMIWVNIQSYPWLWVGAGVIPFLLVTGWWVYYRGRLRPLGRN